jgi:hypothetical protein
MHMQVPYAVVFGQAPKVGINSTRISKELMNKVWKEDDLLKEIGMGDGSFLDTDANGESVVVDDQHDVVMGSDDVTRVTTMVHSTPIPTVAIEVDVGDGEVEEVEGNVSVAQVGDAGRDGESGKSIEEALGGLNEGETSGDDENGNGGLEEADVLDLGQISQSLLNDGKELENEVDSSGDDDGEEEDVNHGGESLGDGGLVVGGLNSIEEDVGNGGLEEGGVKI